MAVKKDIGNPTKKQILKPPIPHGSRINSIGWKTNCQTEKPTTIHNIRKINVLSGFSYAHLLKASNLFTIATIPFIS